MVTVRRPNPYLATWMWVHAASLRGPSVNFQNCVDVLWQIYREMGTVEAAVHQAV